MKSKDRRACRHDVSSELPSFYPRILRPGTRDMWGLFKQEGQIIQCKHDVNTAEWVTIKDREG